MITLAIVAGGALSLTACISTGPTDPPGPEATEGVSASPSVGATSSPAPTAPELEADGSAADNLAYFTNVVESVWASGDRAAGRAYIDALSAAGFDKSAMQVTDDTSTVGNPAESIQFSVRWQDECLVGQVGPATGEPYTVVVPVLAEGTCLVGDTRPIDW